MTNPSNIIRLQTRNGGRGSIYEANAPYQAYSTGIYSGAGVTANTSPDLNVIVGGGTDGTPAASPSNPNIIIAKNHQGYKIMLDIVGTTTLRITPPATSQRVTSIVAYTNDLSIASDQTDVTGNPAQNGLIVVNGNTSSMPNPPKDSDIRAAITADGGTGSQATYAIIANILMESVTDTITNDMILCQYATLKRPKTLKYIFRVCDKREYGEGEVMNIPASELDPNAYYLVLATAAVNYGGGSGDFIMNIKAGDTTIASSAQAAINTWAVFGHAHGIAKPDPSTGFSMRLSMNGRKTQGDQPPRMTLVQLTY